jgi:hypothetical protein
MIYPYKVQLGDRLYLAGEDVPEVTVSVASGTTPDPEDKSEKPKAEKRRGRPPKK